MAARIDVDENGNEKLFNLTDDAEKKTGGHIVLLRGILYPDGTGIGICLSEAGRISEYLE